MNYLDLIIIIPVVLFFIRGISRGFIMELASLAGLVIGILAAYYFSGYVQDFLKDYFTWKEQTVKIAAYIIIFLFFYLIVYLIGKTIEKSIDMLAMGWLNKMLGAIIGLAKGIVLVCIILFIFEKADPNSKVIKPHVKEKSMFYQPIMQLVHFVIK